jgi:hypothetical protein
MFLSTYDFAVRLTVMFIENDPGVETGKIGKKYLAKVLSNG